MAEPAIISEWDFKSAPAEARANALVRKGLDKTLRVVAEEDDTATKPIRFIASTADVDRYSDTIAVDGWDLSNFARNHVMPWCHNTWAPVVGTWVDFGVEDNALVLYGLETPRDLYDFGYMIGQMYRRGFLFAVSVGFIPKKYVFNEDRSGPYGPGCDFLEQELTETSPVVVPANPNALQDDGAKAYAAPFEKARAAGLDTSPLSRTLEMQLEERDAQRIWIPRPAAERLYKSMGGSRFYSVPRSAAPKEPSMSRKTFALVVECNEEQFEKAKAELQKKAGNVGAVVREVRDAADGDGDKDKDDTVKTLKGLVKDLAPLAKTFGEHGKAYESYGKTMGEHCDAMAQHVKDMGALLADGKPGDGDKTSPASVERGGAPHKLSSANSKDVKAAHEALTKVLDRHEGDSGKPADDDGDEDEKALRAELARIKAANADLAMQLTGKVPPKQP